MMKKPPRIQPPKRLLKKLPLLEEGGGGQGEEEKTEARDTAARERCRTIKYPEGEEEEEKKWGMA